MGGACCCDDREMKIKSQEPAKILRTKQAPPQIATPSKQDQKTGQSFVINRAQKSAAVVASPEPVKVMDITLQNLDESSVSKRSKDLREADDDEPTYRFYFIPLETL